MNKNEELCLTVTTFNELLKAKFDEDPDLQNVYLRGELSNFRIYPSGHAYFSLKDDKSVVSAVMWATYVQRLSFRPKDGDEVMIHGSCSVYPASGKYQIYVNFMQLSGQGAELLRLKELAKKLQAEGLFDESRKRRLPLFPKSIGLITAKGSAAIKDMITNIQNRWPLVDIYVFPSLVQGAEAPKDLLRAFKASQEYPLDVLIIGRGGGSSEDLSAFNDESLVRALASSKCPTISAVGHEIDVTLTDYVADKRVSTPTGAAIAAVPDKNVIFEQIDNAGERLVNVYGSKIKNYHERLSSLKNRPCLLNPKSIYEDQLKALEQAGERLTLAYANSLERKKSSISSFSGRLGALSPYGVLNRGYSILKDENGKTITSINDVKCGANIVSELKDGIILSTVKEMESGKHDN